MNIVNKRVMFAGLGIVLLLALTALIVFTTTRNPYGDQIQIQNLDDFTSGKPKNDNSLQAAQRNLLLAVNQNRKTPVTGSSVTDAQARDGSFVQTKNENKRTNSVSMTVDIKSLKQSYKVAYQWSDTSSSENLDAYGGGVTCLAIDELLYGDFKCVDDQILEQGKENYDPVQKILPYTVKYKYTIKRYTAIVESGKVALHVEAFVPSWGDKQAALDQYSIEIKEWLKTKKLNPDTYYFDFIY